MSLKNHIAILKGMNNATVESGWFETARYPDGTSVAYVMAVNELGYVADGGQEIIPARPHIQLAAHNCLPGARKIAEWGIIAIAQGTETPDAVMGKIGLHLEGEIVKSIRDGGWQPNAPSTIAKKGFDKPLIDSGLAWQSVSSKTSLQGDKE